MNNPEGFLVCELDSLPLLDELVLLEVDASDVIAFALQIEQPSEELDSLRLLHVVHVDRGELLKDRLAALLGLVHDHDDTKLRTVAQSLDKFDEFYYGHLVIFELHVLEDKH